jgi:hypothetical protein
MTATARIAFYFLVWSSLSSGAHACGGFFDVTCNLGNIFSRPAPAPNTTPSSKAVNQTTSGGLSPSVSGTGGNVNIVIPGARPLHPVRAYLRAQEIPPAGAGAYGIVVFQARPTPASRSKLMMVCRSFVAYFPRSETSDVPIDDQMITVWPLDNSEAEEAKRDDCAYVLEHYDLNASEAAIKDAHAQQADFDGEGPYLVGWSPSNSRAIPDALVLVIDLSADTTQAEIDQKFQFWKNEIVEDPSKWRRGFIAERIRESIRKFANTYGQAMLEAIKLVGGKKS